MLKTLPFQNDNSDSLFQVLLANSRDLIYLKNLQNDTFEYVSDSVIDILGYTVEQYCKFSKDEFLMIVHEEDRDSVSKMVERAINFSSSNQKFSIEYRIKNAKGNFVLINENFQIIRDAESKPIRIIGYARNIT